MNRTYERYIVYLTLMIAIVLKIFPLPEWATYIRPQFVFLLLMYWTMLGTPYLNVEIAFFVGLILDLLSGTVLGQHALIFPVGVYVLTKLRRQAQYFPMIQQSIIIFILLMLNLALNYWIEGLSGSPPKSWNYWLPAIITTLLWPIISAIFHSFRKKSSMEIFLHE